jgi:hypothetical protein
VPRITVRSWEALAVELFQLAFGSKAACRFGRPDPRHARKGRRTGRDDRIPDALHPFGMDARRRCLANGER